MKTAAQIIDAKGGSATFAARVKRSPGAVSVWKHRNRFPRDAWPEIMQAFPDLTLRRLLQLERTASQR